MALTTFQRIEQKYLIDQSQKDALTSFLKEYMTLDEYCLNDATYKIRNIYLDTEDDALIRNSLQSPKFKQKIRLRKYTGQKDMFIELKMKYNGTVGKRRVSINEMELDNWLHRGVKPKREKYTDKQIVNEIDYFLKNYKVREKVYISYERLGFFLKEDRELRITFDENLRYNRASLDWDNTGSKPILDKNHYVLEIKYNKNLPLWLTKKLDELDIRKVTFSKYGKEHKMKMEEMYHA